MVKLLRESWQKPNLMAIKASRSFIRMSPRKIRDVARIIRGKDAKKSLATLMLTRKDAATVLSKVLKQAIANANNQGIGGILKISRLEIGEGPRYKRFRPVSRGMAHPIIKKTAHIKIELMPQIKQSIAISSKDSVIEKVEKSLPVDIASENQTINEVQTNTKKTTKKTVKSAPKVSKAK